METNDRVSSLHVNCTLQNGQVNASKIAPTPYEVPLRDLQPVFRDVGDTQL